MEKKRKRKNYIKKRERDGVRVQIFNENFSLPEIRDKKGLV
jgi:hypothetical protein